MSLDGKGRRLPDNDCIRRTKLDGVTPNHFWVFAELLSFKEDTILTPVLKDDNANRYVAWTETEPQSDELLEYGNIAPGKGDFKITWEQLGPPIGDEKFGPLPVGKYTWEFYLDDHDSPDAEVEFYVQDNCK